MSRTISEQTLLAMSASDYMNGEQQQFFRDRLVALAGECEKDIASAMAHLRTPVQEPDPVDAAAEEESCRHRLRFMARQQALLGKIRDALRRLDGHEYGYCRISGEPIGLRRLLARPTTEYCAEVKARLEQNERHFAHQRTG
ncbi:hypothetical protein Q670_14995 [Alcanivorax sp. P2S70]|uniref:TraR/DksA family transcriptional regulator n=1 Tax=Alcanivorax sp. P2S70 TaxID=1397527 RepID=UPI0003B4C4A7|nr:TraR/DksA C4-type zinc finger protein [Alcanivorax sp. P2S70]ERP89669.1 hypothetical protein Q670_14995 [Alcanivorax sp. P2S70]